MSDFKKFRKGVAYSVIAIVALVGILGVLGALTYQSSIGSGVAETSSRKADQDISTQKLEFTKAMVLQDVRFSTLNSLLTVTKNGGTSDPETYWTCNNVPQPVMPDEFQAAISNGSLQYMSAYIGALRKEPALAEKSVQLSDPDCMTTTLPEVQTCNHLNCEFIGSGIEEEIMNVTSPVETNYRGPLNVNDVGPTRATNTLRVLDELFANNKVLQIMSTAMAADCTADLDEKYQMAYKDVCAEIIKRLDPDNPEFILCNITEVGAPHTSCMRKKQTEECMSSVSLQTGNDKGILIHIDDLKYEPLGDNTHMEWNIKMVFNLDASECETVDETVNY